MNCSNDLPINCEEDSILVKCFVCSPGFPGLAYQPTNEGRGQLALSALQSAFPGRTGSMWAYISLSEVLTPGLPKEPELPAMQREAVIS